MIPITNTEIESIADEWADDLIAFVNEKLTGNSRARYVVRTGKKNFDSRFDKFRYIFNRGCRINNVIGNEKKFGEKLLIQYLTERQYVIGNRKQIEADVANWNPESRLNNIFKDIFIPLYEDFIKHHTKKVLREKYAYKLFRKLNIRTCPYCNRHYTFTIGKEENGTFSCRPEFDHFYHKEKYPFLAVTFYNLIPSCHECNHGKGTNVSGINPYFQEFDSRFIIVGPNDPNPKKLNRNEIMHVSNENDFEIDFESPNSDEAKNINTFGLKQQYNQHKDYVMDILEKASAYNQLMQQDIVNSFQGVFHSPQDVKNILFGKYLSSAQQSKQPLSKFTRDILHQLDIDV